MPDYKSMYFQLAANVADAVDLLVKAQQDGENTYTKEPQDIALLEKLRPNSRRNE